MLTKFISVSETHFQNTETALKNQQASIQGLETQTDKEGLVEPASELRQGFVVSQDKGEVDHSKTKTEIVSKNAYESCSNNNKGPIHEERRSRTHDKPKSHHDQLNDAPNQLKVGDKVLLDAADLRIATSEPNKGIPLTVLNIFPYGTVEVIHPKFGTFKLIAGMRSVNSSSHYDHKPKRFSHPHGQAHGLAYGHVKTREKIRAHGVLHGRVPQNLYKPLTIHNLPLQKSLTLAAITLHAQLTTPVQCHPHVTIIAYFDNPGTVQFCLGSLVRQLSVPDFGVALGLYTEEFMDDNELSTLHRHIHYSPSKCWRDLVPASATYDPSHSKASALSPSFGYLHAHLAHTLTGRRESTGIITTHDTYFLWSMANGHVLYLPYFITLTIRHQTERHPRGSSLSSPM
ncbi:hypothetical protein GOBAR_AA04271 [Gossypium barbadense]|uniref:Uncharacterized protein n=1 Tax=Gossypium barbadense TaxID=3634 RepID=A0A2P5YL30_GOSBA|nr:hypothetical protein GOBAR_AA04271 [Gossypium barbadense]